MSIAEAHIRQIITWIEVGRPSRESIVLSLEQLIDEFKEQGVFTDEEND